MFKLALKLASFMLVVLSLSLIMSAGGKASASARCPNDFQDAQNNLKWGVTPAFNGSHGGNMAGMIVNAFEAGSPNKNLNMHYQIHSGLYPDAPAQHPGGGQADLNARIFEDVNGNFSNRVSTYQSSTNGLVYDTTGNNLNGFTCPGWDAFGPADLFNNNGGNVGNGYVLDCGPQNNATHFWFTNLSNPTNDGANGQAGYWSIQIVSPGGTYNVDPFTEGSMSYNNNYFKVSNGSNTFVNLVWHPTPPPPPNSTSICNQYTVDTGPATDNVYVRIWDSTGHVLLHQPGNQNNPLQIAGGQGTVTKNYGPPAGRSISVHVQRKSNGTTIYDNAYQNGDPAQPYVGIPQTTCYDTTCTMTVVGNVPGAPPGSQAVVSPGQMTIDVTITNPPDPNTLDLPPNLAGANLAFTSDANSTAGGFSQDIGYTIYKGNTTTFQITIPVPAGINTYTVSGSPVYTGLFYPENAGAGCSQTFAVYQQFSAQVHASSTLNPGSEDPSTADYNTTVDVSPGNPSVYIPTQSTFKKLGGPTLASNPGGIYPPNTALSGSYPIPPGFQAGDQYCAHIDAGYTSGYVGPGGAVIATPGSQASADSCDKVTNEPYFKVFGSGASAGVSLKNSNGTCAPSNSGLLAGWNDNTGGQERGAGSQLSALALIKITGFASAQTNITRPATDLTFANNGPGVSTNTAPGSPDLGGSFSTSGYCVDNVSPPTSGNTQTLSGNSSYGGATNITDSRSVFVNGDVTITGNVTYGSFGSISNAPAFVLHATGNIYVDPSVTELDGLYVSDQKIYTCGDSSGPITSYNTCKNQLYVYGNFLADQLKLGRTYGSLRDEKPTPGSPAVAGTPAVPGGTAPLTVSGNAGPGCTKIDEPQDNNYNPPSYLCVAPADQASGAVKIGWSNNGNTSTLNSQGLTYCTNDWRNVLASLNYRNKNRWTQDFLCSNVPISFGGTQASGQLCNQVTFNTGRRGQWPTSYVCISKSAPATPGTPGVPPGAPSSPACSNAGTRSPNSPNTTCAAEIFRFSPELYLSTPAIQTPSHGGPAWDSVTSLPPVL